MAPQTRRPNYKNLFKNEKRNKNEINFAYYFHFNDLFNNVGQ
jgi:hypothetical protein